MESKLSLVSALLFFGAFTDIALASPFLCQNTRTNRVFVSERRCRSTTSNRAVRTIMDLGRTNGLDSLVDDGSIFEDDVNTSVNGNTTITTGSSIGGSTLGGGSRSPFITSPASGSGTTVTRIPSSNVTTTPGTDTGSVSGVRACSFVEDESSTGSLGDLTAGINCDQLDGEINNNSFLLTYAVDLSSSSSRSAYVYRTDLLNRAGTLGYAQGVQVFATNQDPTEAYGIRLEAVCCPR